MAKIKHCFVCDQTEEDMPLVTLHYKKQKLHMCTSHLPLVIHEPHKISEALEKAVEARHDQDL